MGYTMSETSLREQLTKARGTRSLSEIARNCGVSNATLSRIEAGLIEVPGRETLAAISAGYGLPLEWLAQLVYCGAATSDPEASDDTALLEDGSPPDPNAAWPTHGTRLKHASALT